MELHFTPAAAAAALSQSPLVQLRPHGPVFALGALP